jgi:hypothetical protein
MSKKIQEVSNAKGLEMINPDAAGIDIGSKVHYVCVPAGRDDVRIKSFGCFTEDIHHMAAWLKKCAIKSVAMESTGIYWLRHEAVNGSCLHRKGGDHLYHQVNLGA